MQMGLFRLKEDRFEIKINISILMEVADPGEVLPLGKKYLSLHATPGTLCEVQNAIAWSLSAHINKVLKST